MKNRPTSMTFLVYIVVVIVFFAGMLILSVPTYEKYWHREAKRVAEPNAFIYVALGDSTAQGVGATSPRRGYVGLIAEMIASQTGRPVQIINLSKSGAHITDVLDRQLPTLANLSIKPDLITLEIGANDMVAYNAQEFQVQMDRVMTQLPADAILSDIPAFTNRTQLPFFGSGRPEKNIQAANLVLQTLAATHQRTLVPLHQQISTDNRYPWTYAIDYFHPNNLGYKAWFKAFWQAIEPRL